MKGDPRVQRSLARKLKAELFRHHRISYLENGKGKREKGMTRRNAGNSRTDGNLIFVMVTNDLYGKPFQLKFVRPAQMLLFANAVCDPPLGLATVIPHGQTVRFSIKLCGSASIGVLNFP